MEDGTRGTLHSVTFLPINFVFQFGSEKKWPRIRIESFKGFFVVFFSSGARTQMIKRRPSRALQELPHGYVPRPVELNNLTLNREMLALAEKLAENAHDIWSANLKVDTVFAEIVAWVLIFSNVKFRGATVVEGHFFLYFPLWTMGFYGGGGALWWKVTFSCTSPFEQWGSMGGGTMVEGHFFLYFPLWTMGFYGGGGTMVEGHFFLYFPLWIMGFYGGGGALWWKVTFSCTSPFEQWGSMGGGHYGGRSLFPVLPPLNNGVLWGGALWWKVTFSCTSPFEQWGSMGGGALWWKVTFSCTSPFEQWGSMGGALWWKVTFSCTSPFE